MKAATDIILSPKEDISLIESFALLFCSSLLNEYLWYDKLWGPSQRVVTLFLNKFACICSARLTWILRASREPIYLVGILPLELLGSLVRALSMNTNT